jgi:hypothetical protein
VPRVSQEYLQATAEASCKRRAVFAEEGVRRRADGRHRQGVGAVDRHVLPVLPQQGGPLGRDRPRTTHAWSSRSGPRRRPPGSWRPSQCPGTLRCATTSRPCTRGTARAAPRAPSRPRRTALGPRPPSSATPPSPPSTPRPTSRRSAGRSRRCSLQPGASGGSALSASMRREPSGHASAPGAQPHSDESTRRPKAPDATGLRSLSVSSAGPLPPRPPEARPLLPPLVPSLRPGFPLARPSPSLRQSVLLRARSRGSGSRVLAGP